LPFLNLCPLRAELLSTQALLFLQIRKKVIILHEKLKIINMQDNAPKGEIVIYQNSDSNVAIKVKLEDENVWLTQANLVELYQSSKSNVSEHIKHIYEEGELSESSTVRKFRTVASNGKTYDMEYYNLDLIISLGYRIKSRIATQFRIWATERLKEYIIKGFTMDDERLKNIGGGSYWHELLERIRDIRSSEKILYRQVLDLYATAVDYNPRASESIKFFKIVQNKLHHAAHGHTAAEIVYERADSDKPFMGLTVFAGEQPTKKDVVVAKNYLNSEELKVLNNLVSGYFDFAEIQAMRHRSMYMKDYIRQLDNILTSAGEKSLQNAGSVSHEQAVEKAIAEYRKYQVKTISPVEQAYLDVIKNVPKKIEKQ
jgi:hypothetical protein